MAFFVDTHATLNIQSKHNLKKGESMYYTAKEAIKKLEISRSTLSRWVRDGKIGHKKYHTGYMRYDVDSYIEKYLKERKGE